MKQKDKKLNGHTEQPESKWSANRKNSPEVKQKIERKNKCDLGPDFVAPDGGWGWLILIATGCSNVSG